VNEELAVFLIQRTFTPKRDASGTAWQGGPLTVALPVDDLLLVEEGWIAPRIY